MTPLRLDNIEDAAGAIDGLSDYSADCGAYDIYDVNARSRITVWQYGRRLGWVEVDSDGVVDSCIDRRKGSFRRAFRDAGYDIEQDDG